MSDRQDWDAPIRHLAAAVFGGKSKDEAQREIQAYDDAEAAAKAEERRLDGMWRDRIRAAWDPRWPYEHWDDNDRHPYTVRAMHVRQALDRMDGRESLDALEAMPVGLDPAFYLEGLRQERYRGSRRWSERGTPDDWDSVQRRPIDNDRLRRRLAASVEALRAEQRRIESALGRQVRRQPVRWRTRRRTILEARYSAVVQVLREREGPD